MKLRVKESGFSAVIAVAILVGVTAVGCAGWYVLSANKKTSSSTQPTPTPANSKEVTQPPANTDPSEDGKYLVINEWNVRIPLAESLKGDVKYGIFTSNTGQQGAYFTSKKLVAKTSGSLCDIRSATNENGQGMQGGTIAVARLKSPPAEQSTLTFGPVSDYWYAIDFSNGGACYPGDTGQEKGAFNTAMEAAIRTLSPIEQ